MAVGSHGLRPSASRIYSTVGFPQESASHPRNSLQEWISAHGEDELIKSQKEADGWVRALGCHLRSIAQHPKG